jgi:hypothetical protein
MAANKIMVLKKQLNILKRGGCSCSCPLATMSGAKKKKNTKNMTTCFFGVQGMTGITHGDGMVLERVLHKLL